MYHFTLNVFKPVIMEQASKGASTVKSALLILGTAVIISTMICVQADIWMDQWRNLIRPLTRSIGYERSLTAGRVKKLIHILVLTL